MRETSENNSGVDWGLVAGILFWILVTAGFVTLISSGSTKIPRPFLEIIEASANRQTLIIAHRDGDPVRFPNTRCIWTPDISFPNLTEGAGSLVMFGKERKEGRVSKLEPTETAKLEKKISMKAGKVGKILIVDRKSGQQIFSQTVEIAK